jgi:hypothetical protein
MARDKGNTATTVEDVDVDLPTETVETDVVDATGSPVGESKAPKAAKNPRWSPPEGYVTLVKAAKVITDAKLYFPRDSNVPAELPSQQIYSLANGSSKTDPFPQVWFNDDGTPSEGNVPTNHRAVKPEELTAWWERKNERVKTRAANAAQKATKSKDKPAAAAATVDEATEDDQDLTDSDTGNASELVEAE